MNYRGRPHLKTAAYYFPGSRDSPSAPNNCSKLADGVPKQVDTPGAFLAAYSAVRGVLCFIVADWPLLGGSSTTRGAQAHWPKKLYLTGPNGGHSRPTRSVGDIHATLARNLRTS